MSKATENWVAASRLAVRSLVRFGFIAAAIAAITLGASPLLAGAIGRDAQSGSDGSPPISFMGVITALPADADLVGDWTVGGRTVHVTTATTIDQSKAKAAVGATAAVMGFLESDSSIDAKYIAIFPVGPTAGTIDFVGTVQSLPGTADLTGDWTVGSRTVHVTSATTIDQHVGAPVVGALVEVKGMLESDGSVDAATIEVLALPPGPPLAVDFRGIVKALPSTADLTGDWTVNQIVVHVSSSTTIDQSQGAAAVGALVEVKGTIQTDGSVDATSIIVIQPPPGSLFVDFTGVIVSLPADASFVGDWTVNQTIVHVSSSTTIDQSKGAVALGDLVEVKGQLQTDKSVNATSIVVLSTTPPAVHVEFIGVVQTLPGTSTFIGDWTVSGRTVHVTSATMIDETRGMPAVGAIVLVEGVVETDGSVDATRIKVEVPAGGQVAIQFKGAITSLPSTTDLTGDWVVAGLTVHVTAATTLDPGPSAFAVGTIVCVNGLLNTDGTVNALFITPDDGVASVFHHLGHH